MISKAAKDYFQSFSIKKMFQGNSSTFFWVIYFLIIPLHSMWSAGERDFFNTCYAVYCGGAIIPLFLGMIFMKANPIRLSKIMFLCPASSEQRLQYLRARFFVRTIFPLLLFFLIRLISYSIMGDVRGWLLPDLYVVCSIIASSFVLINGTVTVDVPQEKRSVLQKEKTKQLKGMEMKSYIVMLTGLVWWSIFARSLNDLLLGNNTWLLMVEIIFMSILLVLQIALTISLFHYLPTIFTMACDYERMRKIL